METATLNTDEATVNADKVVVTPAAGAPTPAVIAVTPTVEVGKSDRRRDWALWVVFGGGIAMTAYSAFALWFVRFNPEYTFYLGLGGLVNIMLIFTGLLGLLVKRSLVVSKEGITVNDSQNQPS